MLTFYSDCLTIRPHWSIFLLHRPQLFLQRERAAVLAEAQTDDLIKEAPKPALDQSGEWQETGGEIQWVSNENNPEKQEENSKKKDEEDEELDLNKGTTTASVVIFRDAEECVNVSLPSSSSSSLSSSACREAHGGQHRGLLHSTAAGLPVSGKPCKWNHNTMTSWCEPVTFILV